MQGYAVVDVETTGFSPAWQDRVVEVAVVHVTSDGLVDGESCTLVNPGRDMGPQKVHGIAAADVLAAPTFARPEGDLPRQRPTPRPPKQPETA